MAQFARTISDIVLNGWTNFAGGANLWSSIDELVASDNDGDRSPLAPVNVVAESKLSAVTDPGVGTGHVFRYRIRKNTTAGQQIDLTCELVQGTTVIASFAETNLNFPAVTIERTLSNAQADAITNYADLRFRWTANKVGSGTTRSAQVTWAELEVPNVPTGQELLPPIVPSDFAIFTPVLTVGSVLIDLPAIATAEALYLPTMDPPVIPAESGAFTARVSSVRQGATNRGGLGTVYLTLPTIATGEVLYAPTIAAQGAPTLTLPTIGSGEALFAPTLQQNINPPTITTAEAIYAPALALAGIGLTLPTITTGEAVYAPTLTLGVIGLTLPTIATAEAVYAPTLTLAVYTLTLAAVASQETVYAPTVAPAGLGLTLPTIATGEAVYVPTLAVGAVSLDLAYVATGEAIYTPSLAQLVVLAAVASAEALYAPALSRTISLPAVASGEALYAPTVVPSTAQLTLINVASGLILYTPTIAYVVIARAKGSDAMSSTSHSEPTSGATTHDVELVSTGREASSRTF